MFTFQVNDMTCGHCVSLISKAVRQVDQNAEIRFDLPNKLVRIEPSSVDANELADAIKDAGYSAVPARIAAGVGQQQDKSRGCCCG